MIALASAVLALFPVPNEAPPGFDRHTCKDAFQRSVTYYISNGDPEKRLPLVLVVLGSGGQSAWMRVGNQIYGGIQNLVLGEAKGMARVVVVEKPGVSFCYSPAQPGTALGCPEEFLREHTLPRWAEANVAALKNAWTLPGVDKDRTLVVGHSEGGIVAARTAAMLPKITHLGVLAGGGPSQLFDLALVAGRTSPGAATQVYTQWAKIQADPLSTKEFAWGHPYLRWSTFLSSSTTEEAKKSKAKIFAAAGTLDTAVPIESFDMFQAKILASGRDATFVRIDGADHGFAKKDDPAGPPIGFQSVARRMMAWFLSSKK